MVMGLLLNLLLLSLDYFGEVEGVAGRGKKGVAGRGKKEVGGRGGRSK